MLATNLTNKIKFQWLLSWFLHKWRSLSGTNLSSGESPLNVNKGQGYIISWWAIQCQWYIVSPCRCLWEGDDREVGYSRTCVGERPLLQWEKTTGLEHGRGQELLVKEALHIKMTHSEELFNRDGGLQLPGFWNYPHQPLTSNDAYPQYCIRAAMTWLNFISYVM